MYILLGTGLYYILYMFNRSNRLSIQLNTELINTCISFYHALFVCIYGGLYLSNIDITQVNNITLVNGQAVYTMFRSAADGASDATAVFGVDDVLEASYRDSSNVDVPLTKISRSQYQALSNKSSTGQPSQYFVQRFIDRVTITLYLTPGASQAGDKINYYYVRRIQDAGAYTNATDVPYRFVPCMVSGLSFYLSQKYAPQRTQEFKLYYEDELNRALQEDGSSSSSFITPKSYFSEVN